MSARFAEDGIQFQYPENWELERQDTDTGWTVSVQSPGTAFFMLSFDASRPDTTSMAYTALEALRSEYPGLDADAVVDALAGQPAVGHDVRFFSLDLTNTCWLRSFHAGSGTVLALWETNDLELDTVGRVLQAMAVSIKIDDE